MNLDAEPEGTVRFETREAQVVFWVNQVPVGQVYARVGGSRSPRIGDRAREAVDHRIVLAARGVEEIGAGANMAIRKAAFAEVGLFDERLDAGAAGCSGDAEYWYRGLAAGWRCGYEPSAMVFHYHRRTFGALARQILAYMHGHVAALLVQLRRALIVPPARYALRWSGRLVRRREGSDCPLGQEIRGSLAGVILYLWAKRPTSPDFT